MDLENSLWEAEEGVPQIQDPFIQRFLAGRDSLIHREASQRHDSNLHDALAPVATRACQIVSEVCAQELARFQNADPSSDVRPQSLTSDWPEGSDLWKIVRRLPKGSLLYGHLPAMVDTDFLIDQAFATPGIHISAPNPLITAQLDSPKTRLSFQYCSCSTRLSNDKPTLWSDDYEPSTPIDLKFAAASFPNGAEAGFRRWLKSHLTLALDHEDYPRRDSRAISELFTLCLPIIDSILHYEPVLRSCLRRVFSQLVADRIRYVEFRIAFVFQYKLEGSDTAEEDYTGWLQIFQEEVERFKRSEAGKEFHGARIIWATLRGLSNKDIGLSMKQCLLAKQEFPDLICGFDLLGRETHERSLNDLLPILFWFRGRCAEEGVDIPFIFHAGQSLGDGDQADDNLFEAVLLGSRRIGQALSLYKHPLLIEVIKSKHILIECSPSSSACLGLTNSFQSHPLPALLSRGVSVALSNDSPGIFGLGANGLSPEFCQALLAFHNMGLTGLTMMVENSIRWSCYDNQSSKEWISEIQDGILGEGTKATRLRQFYAEFEEFCEWVVQEFEGKYALTV
ncbi:hypothetical protein BDW59DRAFT_154075 [Aspergillus cavernicola]|uniref:Adenosine deaminase domain-containing protein n=1 Tax=Aspergillus cavernicola TaxID=176166 RepID=A0ABR4HHD7_9EURO